MKSPKSVFGDYIFIYLFIIVIIYFVVLINIVFIYECCVKTMCICNQSE